VLTAVLSLCLSVSVRLYVAIVSHAYARFKASKDISRRVFLVSCIVQGHRQIGELKEPKA